MSRFWAAGGSSDDDSDDSSEDDSEDDSDDDSSMDSGDGGHGGHGGHGGGANRWLDISDSEDSEDQGREVKSGKQKAMDSFTAHVKLLRTHMKTRDYYELSVEFDGLSKSMIKAKQYLKAGVPRFLARILVNLEDYITERLKDKGQFKQLSARQGRALNKMNRTLKHHNKAYKVVMDAYRQNPDQEDDDEDDEPQTQAKGSSKAGGGAGADDDSDDDDSDDDDSDANKAKNDDSSDSSSSSSSSSSDSDSDSDGDDDDSDDWGDDSSSSSSEDEEDAAFSQLKGRDRWLKKNTLSTGKKTKTKSDDPNAAANAAAAKREKKKIKEVELDKGVTASKSILPDNESLTVTLLHRTVSEITSQRGKKVNHRVVLRQLEALSRLSIRFGPRVEIPILMHVISAQFGLQRTLDDYMDTPTWKACAAYLQRIADVLDDGYKLAVLNVDEADMLLRTNAGLGGGGTAAAAVAAGAVGKGGKGDKMKAAASADGGAMAAVAADEQFINPHTNEPETIDERAERLRVEHEATLTDDEKKTIYVVGSVALHIVRLEEEYKKSLQRISHHSAEYIVRLRDESKLVELLTRYQQYFEKMHQDDVNNNAGNDNNKSQEAPVTGSPLAHAASLARLRIEHIYYRHDSQARLVDKAALFYEKFGEVTLLHPACIVEGNNTSGEASSSSSAAAVDYTMMHPASVQGKPTLAPTSDGSTDKAVDFTQVMARLCKFVYKHGTDASKIRATICQIYHFALHDRFMDARDLLLMSHLQETIYGMGDISIMILYNRMMVTLGMCAFRLGRIYDAHQLLSDVCSGRVRELLAQGVNTGRFSEKSAEQEKAEKRRQVPYHQHINLDLLEACHLISAMLLEVPNMAGAAVDGGGSTRRNRVISRSFRKFHDQYNHQVFTGPPEQTRDFVMRAARALMKGDWKVCASLVTKLDVWQLVPGENAAAEIGEMLTEKIKLEGLRTYLFAFSAQYNSLSQSQLCAMFEMTKSEVHSVVSKMMINRELYASWDQPTETIVLRKVEPSSLQIKALQFAEKAAILVDANERLLNAQSGNYDKDDYWKGGGDDDDDDNRRHRHHWHRGGSNYHHHRGGDRGDHHRGGDRGGYRRGNRHGDRGGHRNRGRR